MLDMSELTRACVCVCACVCACVCVCVSLGVQTWYDRYVYDIPVVHVNGTEVARHRVDPVEFARHLHNAQQASTAQQPA
jgi:hypothetical protein